MTGPQRGESGPVGIELVSDHQTEGRWCSSSQVFLAGREGAAFQHTCGVLFADHPLAVRRTTVRVHSGGTQGRSS